MIVLKRWYPSFTGLIIRKVKCVFLAPVFVIHTFIYLCIVYVLVSSTCFPLFSYKSRVEWLNPMLCHYRSYALFSRLFGSNNGSHHLIVNDICSDRFILAQVSQKEKVEILMEKRSSNVATHKWMKRIDWMNETQRKKKQQQRKEQRIFSFYGWKYCITDYYVNSIR